MDYPKVGLALGSGGARGFAHIGVVKVLQEEGIPIHFIAGSSMGALVGALLAVGHDMDQLYKMSNSFRRKFFMDFTVPNMGFISGSRIKEFIRIFSHQKNIEDCQTPLAIVATDLIKGEKVVFREGPIDQAVRASISIPGIFVPEKWDGKLLVDGGVIDRVPVSVVREMGADLVISVDVSHVKRDAEINNIYDVIMQSIDIMQLEVAHRREIDSDIMIKPKVGKYSSRAFTNIQEIISVGEEEARKHLPKIREAIEHWGEHLK
ncbi:patatin-like phospholipase family protein [Mangrovibacillus cuniculi]|uniref:Patatin family protein n=1 Tax=Mangrovibacillus cuniculi TaxID=2593652 RepID=A0A7S8HFA6_9BACI|nr:patatin-like phospholipase family protein [Mangrovibacillus cuniculi]QPC46235.1 patatin family protein [Mangrovibacillus cuniculi]